MPRSCWLLLVLLTAALAAVPVDSSLLPDWNALRTLLVQA